MFSTKQVSTSNLILFQADSFVFKETIHVQPATPIELLMKKILLLMAVGVLISINLAASDRCSLHRIERKIKTQDELIKYLEKSDLKFTSLVETNAVRGVLSASYFSCGQDHGYLVVRLHDGELIYKDVPLKTWFEFKFADSSDTFYKEEIKYNFITT